MYPILKEIHIGYTDTDSFYCSRGEMHHILHKFPNLKIGEEFMQLSYDKEWKNGTNEALIWWLIAPKVYCVEFQDGQLKVRFKGVNVKNDVFISKSQYKVIKKDDNKIREFYLKAINLKRNDYCMQANDGSYNRNIVHSVYDTCVKERRVYFITSQILKIKPYLNKSLTYELSSRTIIKKIKF
jgi:hypothetical protein